LVPLSIEVDQGDAVWWLQDSQTYSSTSHFWKQFYKSV